jgi:hypothetical protein
MQRRGGGRGSRWVFNHGAGDSHSAESKGSGTQATCRGVPDRVLDADRSVNGGEMGETAVIS